MMAVTDVRTTLRCLLSVLILGLAAGPARAQVVSPLDTKTGAFPRIEIGAQTGLELFGDGILLGGGGRLTVNLTARDALEVVAEPAGGFEQSGINGLYFVQYKRMLWHRVPRRIAFFVVVSAGSDFHYDRVPERRDNRPDGSSVIYPAHTRYSLHRLEFGGGGVGIEHIVGRYVATRVEVQGLFFAGAAGIRASAGLTIPIGGFYARVP